MVTAEARELIRRLRLGEFDPGEVEALEKLSASRFVSDLADLYPIAFQERHIGRKREVGLARSLRFALAVRKSPASLFPLMHMHPVLRKCVFVNSYDDAISGLAVATGIHARPKGGPTKDAVLKMGRGYSLDRTSDGWSVKPLNGRTVTLSEDFLRKRGWKFEALRP